MIIKNVSNEKRRLFEFKNSYRIGYKFYEVFYILKDETLNAKCILYVLTL